MYSWLFYFIQLKTLEQSQVYLAQCLHGVNGRQGEEWKVQGPVVFGENFDEDKYKSAP